MTTPIRGSGSADATFACAGVDRCAYDAVRGHLPRVMWLDRLLVQALVLAAGQKLTKEARRGIERTTARGGGWMVLQVGREREEAVGRGEMVGPRVHFEHGQKNLAWHPIFATSALMCGPMQLGLLSKRSRENQSCL